MAGENPHMPKEGEGTVWLFLAYVNRIFYKKKKKILMDKADVGKYSYYIFNQRISGLFAPFSGTLQADRIRTVLPDAMIKKKPVHHKKRPPDRMARESSWLLVPLLQV